MSVYDLTGRKALVTGGGRGLGEGMAQALARAGAAVVIGDIQEDLGKTCADSLRSAGATAEFVPLDVTSDASWERAVAEAVGHLGGHQAGVDAVHPHAVAELAGFHRGNPGQPVHS